TVVGLVRDVSLSAPDQAAADRLLGLSDRLTGVSNTLAPDFVTIRVSDEPSRKDDLAQVRHLLRDLVEQTRAIRRDLRADGHKHFAQQLEEVEDSLMEAADA